MNETSTETEHLLRNPAWGPTEVTGRVCGWQVVSLDLHERSAVFWRLDAAEAELRERDDPESVIVALVQPAGMNQESGNPSSDGQVRS